eukprot:scaffold1986_cov60-Phaeocystis_antarctica.AAC.2
MQTRALLASRFAFVLPGRAPHRARHARRRRSWRGRVDAALRAGVRARVAAGRRALRRAGERGAGPAERIDQQPRRDPAGEARPHSWSGAPTWHCRSSAPAPPRGLPGGSGWLATPEGSGQAAGRPATAFAADSTAFGPPGGLCPFCNLASALLRREQLARDFSLHVGDLLHDEREGLKAMRDADDDGAGERVLTYPVIYIRGSRVAGGCAPHNNSSNPGLASNGVLQYF